MNDNLKITEILGLWDFVISFGKILLKFILSGSHYCCNFVLMVGLERS